ncbi:MAG: hypothetical protein II969_05890 [Anaerolineaceae bacterium]|nr:hypothetical protein [Anaerolineaceae bacterium]
MNEEEYIRKDRMRFTKNSLASTLAIVSIVFDVLYFLNIYSSDINNNVGNFYYQIRIGASIILNLLFMLAAFLSSEGIKNYKSEYGYVMIILGIIQVVRIFILPMQAHAAEVTVGGVTSKVMGNAQFITVIIYLVLSALAMFAGAYIGIKRSKELQAHMATLKKAAA